MPEIYLPYPGSEAAEVRQMILTTFTIQIRINFSVSPEAGLNTPTTQTVI